MSTSRKTALLFAAALLLAPTLGHAEGSVKSKVTYLPVSGLAATITRPDGAHGVMTVDAGLDIPDPSLNALATMQMPLLQDAYTQILTAYAAGLLPGHVPNVDYMAAQLQAATNRVLGRPGARVLLGGVMVN